jgi:hypothetical protein
VGPCAPEDVEHGEVGEDGDDGEWPGEGDTGDQYKYRMIEGRGWLTG